MSSHIIQAESQGTEPGIELPGGGGVVVEKAPPARAIDILWYSIMLTISTVRRQPATWCSGGRGRGGVCVQADLRVIAPLTVGYSQFNITETDYAEAKAVAGQMNLQEVKSVSCFSWPWLSKPPLFGSYY